MKKLWEQYLEENKLLAGGIAAAAILASSIGLYKGLVKRGSKKRSALAARIVYLQRSLGECTKSGDPGICIGKIEEEISSLRLKYARFLE